MGLDGFDSSLLGLQAPACSGKSQSSWKWSRSPPLGPAAYFCFMELPRVVLEVKEKQNEGLVVQIHGFTRWLRTFGSVWSIPW